MGRRNRRLEREVARERVERLAELAREAALEGSLHRATRYADLARRVSMKVQHPLPTHLRRRLCRSCYAYLVPGRNARVRLRTGKLVTTCDACGHVTRVPIGDLDHAAGEG